LVVLNGTAIDRVARFNLLGEHIASDLKWTNHTEAISTKVVSWLYFLKQLKQAGTGLCDLPSFYYTVICPVLSNANKATTHKVQGTAKPGTAQPRPRP